ncbi:Xaa-Pro peptidase family protein [soil metagenome]
MSGSTDASERGSRLAALAGEAGLDQLLVTDLVNVRYLTGFTGTNGACLVGADERIFFTDFRYTERAAEEVGEGWDRPGAERDMVPQIAHAMSGSVGFEDAKVSVRQRSKIGDAVAADGSGADLAPAGDLVERLRAVKDAGELESIEAAAELADDVYRWAIEQGMVGRTELDVARGAVAHMREHGAEPSFPPIVAAGPNGALPHAEPGEREIGAGELVVFDMGAELDGYCSDCTRTFATGEIDEGAREVYELVRSAQEAALAAVRPGAGGKEVDAVSREPIDDAGHSEHYGHGLGHGVGLEVHEGPRLSQSSDDELSEGNVVTVEPGVYVPGSLGVRIEDLVVVEADGPRILSGLPKELTEVS